MGDEQARSTRGHSDRKEMAPRERSARTRVGWDRSPKDEAKDPEQM